MSEEQQGNENETSKGEKSMRLFLCSQNDSRDSSYFELSTQEISLKFHHNELFSRKVVRERERLTLAKKSKMNGKKKEYLSLSRNGSKVLSFSSLDHFFFAHFLLYCVHSNTHTHTHSLDA